MDSCVLPIHLNNANDGPITSLDSLSILYYYYTKLNNQHEQNPIPTQCDLNYSTTRCVILTESRNWCYRSSFAKHDLRPVLTDLHDGFSSTVIIHLYLPKSPDHSKPNFLLIHGLGANALWQVGDALPHLSPRFNLYVPDLLFFGYSYIDLPDRSDSIQARCIARALKAHSVARFSLVGLSVHSI